jgi:hypothetical protein
LEKIQIQAMLIRPPIQASREMTPSIRAINILAILSNILIILILIQIQIPTILIQTTAFSAPSSPPSPEA